MTDAPEAPAPPPIPTPAGPATTGAWRAQNENIGPVFQFGGLFLLACDLGVLVLLIVTKTAISVPVVIALIGFALACLLLIRPPGFDNLIKTIADRLPFLSYKKPEDGGS